MHDFVVIKMISTWQFGCIGMFIILYSGDDCNTKDLQLSQFALWSIVNVLISVCQCYPLQSPYENLNFIVHLSCKQNYCSKFYIVQFQGASILLFTVGVGIPWSRAGALLRPQILKKCTKLRNLQFPEGWGSYKKNLFCGRNMDYFWNCTCFSAKEKCVVKKTSVPFHGGYFCLKPWKFQFWFILS